LATQPNPKPTILYNPAYHPHNTTNHNTIPTPTTTPSPQKTTTPSHLSTTPPPQKIIFRYRRHTNNLNATIELHKKVIGLKRPGGI